METKMLLPVVYVLISCIATVLTNEEIFGDLDFGRSLRHHIVKRKGGGRGGGRGRGRGNSSWQKNYPYPRQQYGQTGNTQYNQQRPPPYNPGYPAGAGGRYNSASNPGYRYPDYGNIGQQQHGMNNMGNSGKAGGIGGILGGAGAAGLGARGLGHGSKGIGMGGVLGGAALGGIGGAVLGSVAGYQLGKAVGGFGRHGHYDYWDSGVYHACEPPSRIEYNPETMEQYIPHDISYNESCSYYDAAPSKYYGYFEGNRFIRCELPRVEVNPLTNETYVNYGENVNHRCRYYERYPIRYTINAGVELYLSFVCLMIAFMVRFV